MPLTPPRPEKKTLKVAFPQGILETTLNRAQDLLLSQQFAEGYWWYSLEANESICAEYIFLTEFLGVTDPQINKLICQRILSQQRSDGSWAIFFEAPGDLSTTLECYWALKLCGYSPQTHEAMARAKDFILHNGGPTQSRVFTKIHLAMFGLAPWSSVPSMPISLILMPSWAPINIYEFSSWARACIVPLLVILEEKPVHPLKIDLEELYSEPPQNRQWNFNSSHGKFSLEQGFIYLDKLLKNIDKFNSFSILKPLAIKRCLQFIRDHIEKTEDIYPALAYGAMAIKTMGHGPQDPTIAKCLKALRSFQQVGWEDLPAFPQQKATASEGKQPYLYQQCCISPVWDTPWAALALVESGLATDHPALFRAADWLVQKQITSVYGDWSIKNKKGKPGGWSFEFENDFFPDVDDTIEVLMLLHRLGLEDPKQKKSYDLGLQWLTSMQSKNGGWAAFDVDNTLQLVNRIPFSDHGACLDPPTPDITGRMLEFFGQIGRPRSSKEVKSALKFIYRTQTPCGAWPGRWGVNYLYGTWCVLQGLHSIGENLSDPRIQKACHWLMETQDGDGGWGESCEGDRKKKFVPLKKSVPSQTAWALMGLMAAGKSESLAVSRGIEFLIRTQKSNGAWEEKEHTGTGFPGHFYIRYHGYRHYFPLMALGKYRQALQKIASK